MTHILDQIIAEKQREVAARKVAHPIEKLEKMPGFTRTCLSLAAALQSEKTFGVIAEIKRASPSAGLLFPDLSVAEVATGYVQNGATALSILTDQKFFSGSLDDLITARVHCTVPILRKDFMIDEYQIVESRAHGADVILLIVRILSPLQCAQFAALARSLGMDVLLEVHNEAEMQTHLCDDVNIIGVNARDLDRLQNDPALHENIFPYLPPGIPAVAESGIRDSAQLARLKQIGYHGFLIGEQFLKTAHPGAACGEMIAVAQKILPDQNAP